MSHLPVTGNVQRPFTTVINVIHPSMLANVDKCRQTSRHAKWEDAITLFQQAAAPRRASINNATHGQTPGCRRFATPVAPLNNAPFGKQTRSPAHDQFAWAISARHTGQLTPTAHQIVDNGTMFNNARQRTTATSQSPQ